MAVGDGEESGFDGRAMAPRPPIISLAPTTPTLDRPRRRPPRPVRSGRSRIIGVLNFDPTAYGTASALRGIQHATGDSGDFMSIVNVPVPSRRSVRTAVARLRSLGADGILAVAPQPSIVEALAVLPGDTPIVAVGPGPQDGLPAVAVDHYGGAAAVTRHLLGLGHRTVFHIAGPTDRTDPGPASRGMARHAGRRRGGAPAAAGRRLDGRVGVRARAPPCRQGRRHRDLRGQRPDGPRRAARAFRHRPARAARRQRRRL